jgi:hypothetical protein
MDLEEIGWGVCGVAQDRGRWQAVVNAGMNLWVLSPLS